MKAQSRLLGAVLNSWCVSEEICKREWPNFVLEVVFLPFELVQCSRANPISLKTTKSWQRSCVVIEYASFSNFFSLNSLVVVKFYRVQTGISKWVVSDSHAIVGCNTVPGQFEIQGLRSCFRVSLLHAVLALVRLLLSESVMLRAWSRENESSDFLLAGYKKMRQIFWLAFDLMSKNHLKSNGIWAGMQ